MIGKKVLLTNGRYAKVVKVISPLSVIINYRGNEGESTRVVSYEEMMAGPIDLCLFDKTLYGANAGYEKIQRNSDGTPIKRIL